jgi:hypothetical protein
MLTGENGSTRKTEEETVPVTLLASLQNCENQLLTSCLHVCLSVRMGKLGSHWPDFDEI